MKKLLFILLLLQITLINAQQYHSFPDSNAIWNNMQYTYYNNDTVYTQYGLIGDTTINSIPYHKLYLLNDTSLNVLTSSYFGAIREDAKKIYFHYRFCQNEALIYDFTKQVGDTIKSLFSEMDIMFCIDTTPYNGTITGIDSTMINGSYHKVYHIGPWYPDWIEGIGSLTGILNPIPPQITGFDRWELVCFKKDGIVEYHNPNFNNCFPLSSGINDELGSVNNSITYYPNPANDKINLQIPPQFGQTKTLEIFDCMGQQQLIKTEGFSETDISSLAKGSYFVVLTNGDNERWVGKIIKE